jgi:hypothetical protein
MAKKKMTKAERERWEAERRRIDENIERTRRLAEKALAELEAKKRG